MVNVPKSCTAWDISGEKNGILWILNISVQDLWPNSTTQRVVGFPTPTSTRSTPKIGWWNCRTSLTNWTLGTCLLVFLVQCVLWKIFQIFTPTLFTPFVLFTFWWSVPKNDWVFCFFAWWEREIEHLTGRIKQCKWSDLPGPVVRGNGIVLLATSWYLQIVHVRGSPERLWKVKPPPKKKHENHHHHHHHHDNNNNNDNDNDKKAKKQKSKKSQSQPA